jgi:uncharacterized protein YndB with AHSA1/START domain
MSNSRKLKVVASGEREIVITRSFDAPPHLVWQAMTRPELIRRWLFLPPGWTMTRCDEDVRVGGAYRWEWAGPDGKPAMSVGGVYKEVVPHRRVVRTEKFDFGCQAQAGEQVGTMEFTERDGETTVTITVAYPSKEARDGALASGMEQGMSASYDNLEAMLAEGAALPA